MWLNLLLGSFLLFVSSGDADLDTYNHRPYIINGTKILIEDAPYQVHVGSCGGSIISSKWILTAAHCTDKYDSKPNNLRIRAGTSESKSGGQLYKVKRIIQHTGFTFRDLDNDISLLELEKEIKFDKTKQLVKLPQANEIFKDGNMCLVTGWGRTSMGGPESEWLLGVHVPLVNWQLCKEQYSGNPSTPTITERMICAGYLEGGKDACQQDSGGPLVNEAGVQVGIVSWGKGCALPKFPGVYANVANLRNWIREHSGL